MPLPHEVQVRISSEAAGAISMTPVVNRTIPIRELVETILATTGKDAARLRDLLVRGGIVQGASRFRWEPVQADEQDLAALLATFPDPDRNRAFAAERCIHVRLKAGSHVIEMPREIASERRMLRRRSFWNTLMVLAANSAPEYLDYSYRTRCDEYVVRVSPRDVDRLRESADLLRYSGLTAQVRMLAIDCIEYSVRFEGSSRE